MRFGFITFRSHPLDKNLDDYYLTLLQPLLKKTEKYLLGIDKKNTLEQHFHLILSGPDSMDITNLRQKFNSAHFKQFYKKIKDEQLSTSIDSKFQQGALNIKMVEKSKEDFQKTLGYCAKEHIHTSKGFSEDDVTQAIKYHFITERLDNSDPLENNWKILTTRNAHAYLEKFSKDHNIKYTDSTFPVHLAKAKISMINISKKQQEQLFAELIIAEDNPDDQFTKNYHTAVLQEANPLFYHDLMLKYKQLIGHLQEEGQHIPHHFYDVIN